MADSKLTALTETSVPAFDDVTYTADVSDTADDAAGSSRKLTLSRLLGLAGNAPGGRLTTESGVPVSTSDRTSQSTLYYTPFVTDYVRLYDGTRVKGYSFTERSLALSGLTSGKNYDVFLYDNAGTLTLELSAAWTNDTTRADALAWQAGVGYVKSGTATRLWLGTIRTTGTTTTEDSGGGSTTQVGGKRFIWNLFNRVSRQLGVIDTTDSWSYATGTIRQANSAAGNKVEYIVGLQMEKVAADLRIGMYGSSHATRGAYAGIGVDSTTAFSGVRQSAYNPSGTNMHFGLSGSYAGMPGLGYHYLAWLEKGSDGTCVFFGDDGAFGTQCGLVGEVWG